MPEATFPWNVPYESVTVGGGTLEGVEAPPIGLGICKQQGQEGTRARGFVHVRAQPQ
jgi:hypothetical protein